MRDEFERLGSRRTAGDCYADRVQLPVGNGPSPLLGNPLGSQNAVEMVSGNPMNQHMAGTDRIFGATSVGLSPESRLSATISLLLQSPSSTLDASKNLDTFAATISMTTRARARICLGC